MRYLLMLFFALPGILVVAPAAAQGLDVSPVITEVLPGARGAVLTVANHRDTASDVQVRAFDWKQANGEDVLTDSNTLILSPPIAHIPPGATQIFRILLRGPSPAGQEGTWRLLLDELPNGKMSGLGVKTMMRLSMPVFRLASIKSRPGLAWHRMGGDIVVANRGDRRVRIASLSVRTAGKDIPLKDAASPYVLTGASKRWALPQGFAGAVHVIGQSDIGTIDADVPDTAGG